MGGTHKKVVRSSGPNVYRGFTRQICRQAPVRKASGFQGAAIALIQGCYERRTQREMARSGTMAGAGRGTAPAERIDTEAPASGDPAKMGRGDFGPLECPYLCFPFAPCQHLYRH